MNEPAVAPHRSRADTLFLWPDLHRPSLPLRLPDDPEVASASAEPAAVCERLETELAATAWRYRRLLVSGVAAVLAPALWWAWAWLMTQYIPGMWHLPYQQGGLFPGPSFFEVVALILLLAVLVWGQLPFGENMRSLRRLGTDYRRLRDGGATFRQEVLAEVATGRWPRVAALLRLGRELSSYRTVRESVDA